MGCGCVSKLEILLLGGNSGRPLFLGRQIGPTFWQQKVSRNCLSSFFGTPFCGHKTVSKMGPNLHFRSMCQVLLTRLIMLKPKLKLVKFWFRQMPGSTHGSGCAFRTHCNCSNDWWYSGAVRSTILQALANWRRFQIIVKRPHRWRVLFLDVLDGCVNHRFDFESRPSSLPAHDRRPVG